MKTRMPIDGHTKVHEDGSTWLLRAVLAGDAWWRAAERSGSAEAAKQS
jgi:hypothetical protein